MGVCGVAFVAGRGPLASAFTTDPEVALLTGQLLLYAAAFQVIDAVAMVHLCALRSAGDTRFTLLLTTGAAWSVLVPASILLGAVLGWGAPGAWLGMCLELTLLAAVSGWRVAGLHTGRVGRLDLLLGRERG